MSSRCLFAVLGLLFTGAAAQSVHLKGVVLHDTQCRGARGVSCEIFWGPKNRVYQIAAASQSTVAPWIGWQVEIQGAFAGDTVTVTHVQPLKNEPHVVRGTIQSVACAPPQAGACAALVADPAEAIQNPVIPIANPNQVRADIGKRVAATGLRVGDALTVTGVKALGPPSAVVAGILKKVPCPGAAGKTCDAVLADKTGQPIAVANPKAFTPLMVNQPVVAFGRLDGATLTAAVAYRMRPPGGLPANAWHFHAKGTLLDDSGHDILVMDGNRVLQIMNPPKVRKYVGHSIPVDGVVMGRVLMVVNLNVYHGSADSDPSGNPGWALPPNPNIIPGSIW